MPQTTYWIGGTVGNVSNWSIAANWSTGSAPGNGDTVYLNELGQYDITSGLNQSATSLTIYSSVGKTFQVGTQTSGLRPGNNSIVYEGQVPIGVQPTIGSPWVRYSCYGDVTTFYVFGTSNNQSNYSGQSLLNIDGGTTGTKIYIIGSGSSNYAPQVTVGPSGAAGTVDLVAISAAGAQVNIGPGITLGSFQASQGIATINCGITGQLSSTGGASVLVQGGGTVGTAQIGGSVVFNNRNGGGGIITTLTVLPEAIVDFSQNPASATVTTLNQYCSATKNSTVKVNGADPAHITFTTRNYIDGGTLTLST